MQCLYFSASRDRHTKQGYVIKNEFIIFLFQDDTCCALWLAHNNEREEIDYILFSGFTSVN